MAENDDLRALTAVLSRREKTHNIPFCCRNVNDQTIGVWLRDTEANKTIRERSEGNKKKFFLVRLKETALSWHQQLRWQKKFPREAYNDWRNAPKEHFKNPEDKAKQKNKPISSEEGPKAGL